MLAVSPLAAMRSAPTTTRSTLPCRISDPAMLSVITVVWMPSRTSSQAVRRAPCRNGRVSSAKTATCLPASTRAANHAERRAVAGGRQRAGVAVRQDARVVRHDRRAERAHRAAARDVLVVDGLRLAVEPVLDLVDRLARLRAPRRTSASSDRWPRTDSRPSAASPPSARRSCRTRRRTSACRSPCSCASPSAMPIAAATPMAGAPRITMVLIARATSVAVLQRT